jgi:hypothetical protein
MADDKREEDAGPVAGRAAGPAPKTEKQDDASPGAVADEKAAEQRDRSK